MNDAPEAPDAPDCLVQLRIERQLHRVLVDYARLCDERDWERIDQVFAPDASAEYGGWPLADRAAILKMLQRHLGGCGPTQHLLGNLLVDHLEPAAARSRVAVRAAHLGSGALAAERYECLGEYRDLWTLTPAGWRIRHRRMVVTLEYGSRQVLRPAGA
jgi:hypothetical protein